LHFAVAPSGGAALVDAEGVNFEGGVAASAAGFAIAPVVPGDGFCTPPWPLHAPLPVAVEVVPSLQVWVGGAEVESARLGSDIVSASTGAAKMAAMCILFMKTFPLLD
jgi:hypothetical protein